MPQHLEKAIETTMGVSLQNLVTETDKQAQAAIQYLKEYKKGRATFLPLNTVRGQRAEEDLSTEANVLGLAVDLIEFDAAYEAIMLHLLGKVWVVADLASAVDIGKKRGFHHRMVTLDGELVTPGGALTGGNHEKERGGLLARQRQIMQLEEQVLQLERQIAQQNNDLDAYYAETGEKKAEVAALHQQDQTLIRSIAQLEQQMDQQQKEELRLQRELEFEQVSLQEQEQYLKEQAETLLQEQQRQQQLAEEEALLNVQTEEIKISSNSSNSSKKHYRIFAVKMKLCWRPLSSVGNC